MNKTNLPKVKSVVLPVTRAMTRIPGLESTKFVSCTTPHGLLIVHTPPNWLTRHYGMHKLYNQTRFPAKYGKFQENNALFGGHLRQDKIEIEPYYKRPVKGTLDDMLQLQAHAIDFLKRGYLGTIPVHFDWKGKKNLGTLKQVADGDFELTI